MARCLEQAARLDTNRHTVDRVHRGLGCAVDQDHGRSTGGTPNRQGRGEAGWLASQTAADDGGATRHRTREAAEGEKGRRREHSPCAKVARATGGGGGPTAYRGREVEDGDLGSAVEGPSLEIAELRRRGPRPKEARNVDARPPELEGDDGARVARSDAAKALRWRCRAIVPNRKPRVATDGAMEAHFALLRKSWQVEVNQDEEVDGLPKLVMPKGAKVLTLVQAETEARKMVGDVSITEYSQLLTRKAAGRANRVHDGDLPSREKPSKADGDEGTSKKRKREQAKSAPQKRKAPASTDSDADDEDTVDDQYDEEEGEDEEEAKVAVEPAANEPADNRTETHGYTPTPSPDHVVTGVESNSSPLRRKDLHRAKALVSIAAGKVVKGGPVKKTSKKKGFVDVACVFSDDESSDETSTSAAGWSQDLSTAPDAATDTGEAGGSAAAGTSGSADRVVKAAARLFGSPPHSPPTSPLAIQNGKKAAVETSASEYSLTAPCFVPWDFETRVDLTPFIEGVSHLVSPAGSPSLFTELNEFNEGCTAVKSLAVWIPAAHCSTERTVRARLDSFKSRLRAKDEELGRKGLEMENLANTLKETKTENKQLQVELEKGSERRPRSSASRLSLKKNEISPPP
uniref:Uncharacterized protein n=1 Tax=Oryza sativa subsp. japonica TaxID=39947 RepID=Q8LNK6_ORYSJ|nr:Hypothetical protein [Oryza sativa Japonica Group]